jgi:hypothetical protein
MDNLGAIGGPLLALALVALLGVRTAILLSVVPGLLAVVAIVIAIRSAPRLGVRERRPLRIRCAPFYAVASAVSSSVSVPSSSATPPQRC